MRPYVPKEEHEPTRTSRHDPAGFETLPPEDPEEVYARLQRQQRRRRAVIVVMTLAALMIGGAVLLDRGLVESPTGVETFGDVELPEVPDLRNTWVGKALDEAKQAREAEAAPRGVIRPIEGRKESLGKAAPADAQPAVGDEAAQRADDAGRSAEEAARAAPPPSAPAAGTARTGKSDPTATRKTAVATRERPPLPAPVVKAAGSAVEATRDSAPAAPAGGKEQAPKPESITGAPESGKEPEKAAVRTAESPPLADAPGVIVISPADGQVDDDAFYEDTQPDDAPIDPEQFRPRRPWPVPKGPPPAGGRVGSFSLVTLPSAEVRFRDHPLGSTPLHSQQLPSGRQRLILIGPDGVRRVLILDIEADTHAEIQLPISRLMPEALMP